MGKSPKNSNLHFHCPFGPYHKLRTAYSCKGIVRKLHIKKRNEKILVSLTYRSSGEFPIKFESNSYTKSIIGLINSMDP